jgi:glycosyltransferase involved in cell wall biosynthesis
MHILVITPVYPHAASPTEGLFNEQHVKALARRGVRVTVVVCKPWLPNKLSKWWRRYGSLADLPQIEERNGIPIVYARYLHIPQYQLPYVTVRSCACSILQAVNRFNSREPFDVVQVHSSWPAGLAAPMVAKRMVCPFVLTLHIQEEPRLYASKGGSILYRRMLEEASAVIAVGSALERFAKERGLGSRSGRLRVIPNGVDLTTVREVLREVSGGQEGWGNVISVANLWLIKGIDLNLRSLARLAEAGVPWQTYTIVGDGPERPRLEKLAKDLGIAGRVKFTGRLSHRTTLAEIAKADIFCLPSWQEAFGVVYLEAMACGKPVIGCYGQGPEDIVRHGIDGLLVAPQDVEDLMEAMKQLLEDQESTRELGKSAKSRAQEFTWERNAKEYLKLYQEVCSQRMDGRAQGNAARSNTAIGDAGLTPQEAHDRVRQANVR